MTRTLLAPSVERLVDRVEVDPSGTSATLDGHRVEAATVPELVATLASKVYDVVHTGSDYRERGRKEARDLEFERMLAKATDGMEIRLPVTSLRDDPVEEDNVLVHLEDGVVLRVRRNRMRDDILDAGCPVPAGRPRLSPGFFLSSTTRPAGFISSGTLLRLYLRVDDSAAAPATWARVVETLETSLDIPWRAKVLSDPASYPRTDAIVIYLNRRGWKQLDSLLDTLVEEPAIAGETSPFAERIADGISYGFEPIAQSESMRSMSFGQHRSRAFVEALVNHAIDGRATPIDEAVCNHFLGYAIDPLQPARNVSSPALSIRSRDLQHSGTE